VNEGEVPETTQEIFRVVLDLLKKPTLSTRAVDISIEYAVEPITVVPVCGSNSLIENWMVGVVPVGAAVMLTTRFTYVPGFPSTVVFPLEVSVALF
jgi:hypothetical protein